MVLVNRFPGFTMSGGALTRTSTLEGPILDADSTYLALRFPALSYSAIAREADLLAILGLSSRTCVEDVGMVLERVMRHLGGGE